MAILGRSMRERNPLVVAVVGTVVLVAVLVLSFEFSAIDDAFTKRSFAADFSEIGGLSSGDEVRMSGVKVGSVASITLEDATAQQPQGYVRVTFEVDKDIPLGEDTSVAISTATVLGTKFLALTPSGPGRLHGDIVRTTPPYDITQELSQLTDETSQLDTTQLADSLNTLSAAFSTSAPDVKTALSGVSRLSTTVASRDAALRSLLADANGVTKILADRDAQFTALFADGDLLLQELEQQRDGYQDAIRSVTQVVQQINGFVDDNKAVLGPALTQLQGVLTTLNAHSDDLVATINGLKRYATGLGEAVGGGPYFYAYIQNLDLTNFTKCAGLGISGLTLPCSLTAGGS